DRTAARRAERFFRLENAAAAAAPRPADKPRLRARRIQKQLDEIFRVALGHQSDAARWCEDVEEMIFSAKRLRQLAYQRYDDGVEPWPEQAGRFVVAHATLGGLQLRPLDGLQ